jgi:hypothetical protein
MSGALGQVTGTFLHPVRGSGGCCRPRHPDLLRDHLDVQSHAYPPLAMDDLERFQIQLYSEFEHI